MKYLTQYVPQGSGISDGYVVIEEAGVLKAQKLSFDGTTASPDGTAEVIDNVGLFATGMDEPAYEGNDGGSTEKPEKEMPTDGLVLYESFASDVGSFTVRSGSPVFTRIDNIQCMLVNPSICTLYKDSTELPSGGASRSISTFIRFNDLSSNVFGFYVSYGGTDSNVFSVGTQSGYFVVYRKGAPKTEFQCEVNKWYHVCVTYENGFVQLFVDGNMVYRNNYTYDTETGSSYPVGIGWLPTQNADFSADGYISGVRIYNRALTVDEITLLASEFDEDNEADNGCSMKFYKCSSVDTESNTWSGYELIYNEAGYYELATTLTEDLTYSGMTPVVDCIYNEDANLRIDRYSRNPDLIPEEGLVFYAPLSEASDIAATGQALSYTGELTYGVNDGLPAAYFDGSSYFSLPFTTDTDSLTESIWLKVDSNASYGYLIAFHQENYGRFSIVLQSDGVYYSAQDGNDSYAIKAQSIDSVTAWHHICVVRNGNVWTIYIDGIKSAESTFSYSPSSATRYYGRAVYTSYDRKNWHGWMAGIRSYNRALTQDEITTLANEFTPTTA